MFAKFRWQLQKRRKGKRSFKSSEDLEHYKIVSNPLNICQASKDYENVTETECPPENRYQENRMVTFSSSTESAVDLAEHKTGNGEINQEDDITDKNVPTSVPQF